MVTCILYQAHYNTPQNIVYQAYYNTLQKNFLQDTLQHPTPHRIFHTRHTIQHPTPHKILYTRHTTTPYKKIL